LTTKKKSKKKKNKIIIFDELGIYQKFRVCPLGTKCIKDSCSNCPRTKLAFMVYL